MRPAAGAGARLAELRRAIRFGSKTWLSEMFWGLNFRLDVVILNAYVSSSVVGVYFVAGSLGTMAWILPSALQTVLLPRAAALDAAVQRGELASEDSDATVARSLRHAVLLSAPTALALAVLYLAGVPLLFGSAFTDAIAYGFILMPGVLVAGVGKVAAGVLAGRGRPGYTLLPMLVATPVTVVLYLLVIPSLEATGAAIVSSVSYVFSAALTIALVRRVTGISYRSLLVPRAGDVADYRVMLGNLRQYARDRSRRGVRGGSPDG
jgi:O-antigen/teichoic acid export membrane protein